MRLFHKLWSHLSLRPVVGSVLLRSSGVVVIPT